MNPILPKGSRVRFLRDWRGEHGFVASAGQTATVTGGYSSVLVCLDGFEDEQRAERESLDKLLRGLPAYVNRWTAGVPLEVLEVL